MDERDAGNPGARDDGAMTGIEGGASPDTSPGGSVAGAEAGVAMPDSATPAAAEPASAVSDSAEPDSATPAAAEPASAVPDSAEPDSARPAAAEPASAVPDSAEPDSALPAVAVPPIAATATVLAWSVGGESEGEDELDAFPLPSAARSQELIAVSVAAGQPDQPTSAVTVLEAEPLVEPAQEPSADVLATEDPAEAIRRFHRQIGLAPAEPVDVVESPEAAPGGEDAGGDDGSGGGAAVPAGAGDGGRRRRLEIVDKPMTIFEHLDELRKRIVWAGLAFVLGVAVTFPFIGRILIYATNGAQVQSIQPLEPLYAGLRIAVLGGLILGSPVILYQVIAYVLPALTGGERRILYTYLPATMVLFVIGLSFGLFVFEPLVVKMSTEFLRWVPYHPSLSSYVNFIIGYSLPFGLLFQLPVIMSILVRLGIVTPAALIAGRRWAAMGALVVAVMFAPPLDFIVTPSIIFVPLYGLYELSIVVAKRAYRQRLRDQAAAGDGEASA